MHFSILHYPDVTFNISEKESYVHKIDHRGKRKYVYAFTKIILIFGLIAT